MTTTTRTLHMGVQPNGLLHVARAVRSFGLTPLVDGDGWEVWGEPVDQDDNDGVTLHVVVEGVQYDSDALDVLRAANGPGIGRLVPMRRNVESSGDVLGVTTEPDDWSEGPESLLVRFAVDGIVEYRIEGVVKP
ncbi:hypothetical protein ABRQ22_14890 [Cellulosimicrobium sp. ES-005]|uniref:Glyoxalase-like domain-containing protein n=1 Tax=Cellulosimicrobium sp. ES-005 TaxID=3163031 RepID=A0AAU8FXR9_9MICO